MDRLDRLAAHLMGGGAAGGPQVPVQALHRVGVAAAATEKFKVAVLGEPV